MGLLFGLLKRQIAGFRPNSAKRASEFRKIGQARNCQNRAISCNSEGVGERRVRARQFLLSSPLSRSLPLYIPGLPEILAFVIKKLDGLLSWEAGVLPLNYSRSR